MKYLTRADEILMVSIAALDENAYSTTIRSEAQRRVGKNVTVGSLWVSLDHLAERGFVRKSQRRPEDGQGGRPRVYYRLTPKGVRALERSHKFQERLWKDLPDLTSYVVREEA